MVARIPAHYAHSTPFLFVPRSLLLNSQNDATQYVASLSYAEFKIGDEHGQT